MGLIDKILTAVGLKHDISSVISIDLKKRRRIKITPHRLPENIIETKTGIFEVQNTADSVQWKRVQTEKETIPEGLTDKDIAELEKRNIAQDLIKAAELKRIWKAGAPASAAIGVKLRTAQKYWASFNAKNKTK